ncbi:hypothetical protein XI07_15775 [Bradyrhizobium sp. CCBAU 11445]|uniref:hypothetical protein n=1 Tax=unclassified Bradyrhizobium TaxID=2631580 RepID=UPI002305FD76|nr:MULTISPECIES: hypothetical protein [unclassified Bradyrhizobium]MDA9483444.1 hypothetical protein [Bradyrhizobium sp. CCBAU 11445]MDA9523321.1 hypothetical protein [Bradyrhizobium sp. CCBAU 11434]
MEIANLRGVDWRARVYALTSSIAFPEGEVLDSEDLLHGSSCQAANDLLQAMRLRAAERLLAIRIIPRHIINSIKRLERPSELLALLSKHKALNTHGRPDIELYRMAERTLRTAPDLNDPSHKTATDVKKLIFAGVASGQV